LQNLPASWTGGFRKSAAFPAGSFSDLQNLQLWIDHLHPDDRQLVLDERQNLIQGKLKRHSIEYRYLHPADGLKWIHHAARVVEHAATGRALRIISVYRDITQSKMAERETQELRDNLMHLTPREHPGALSGSLAHELNQPLGIILSNAQAAQELLAQQPPDVCRSAEYPPGHRGRGPSRWRGHCPVCVPCSEEVNCPGSRFSSTRSSKRYCRSPGPTSWHEALPWSANSAMACLRLQGIMCSSSSSF